MVAGRGRFLVSTQTLLVSASVTLFLVVGGVVVFIGARGMDDALRAATREQFANLALLTQERARRLIEPVQSLLRILAHDPISTATDLDARLARLPVLTATLAGAGTIQSVYAGYPNGEFLLLRKIDSDGVRDRFEAPPDTAFLVQSITLEADGTAAGAYRYYDDHLTLLETRPQPDYVYDPRTRPWYAASETTPLAVTSAPYAFFTTGEIGITVSQRAVNGRATIAFDATIARLGQEVGRMRITPGAEVAIVDRNGEMIAYPDLTRTFVVGPDGRIARNTLSGLEAPALEQIAGTYGLAGPPQSGVVQAAGREWIFSSRPMDVGAEAPVRLIFAAPTDELSASARAILRDQSLVVLVVMLLSVPVGLFIIRQITRPLRQLADDVRGLASFEFDEPVETATRLREPAELAETVEQLRVTIGRFLDINRAITAEGDFDALLVRLLDEIVATTKTEAGILYLVSDDGATLAPHAARRKAGEPLDVRPPPVAMSAGAALLVRSAADERAEGAPASTEELTRMGLDDIESALEAPPRHLLAAPLFNHEKELVGVILLLEAATIDPALVRFTEALSGSAAVTVATRQLIAVQRRLFESFVQLIAGAIDAKSPYTGGHCARVPELTKMLAKAAADARSGPFRDFRLSQGDWEAVHIAAWLHDCGKVTTPEYVVDKATKLETIYDRIHEVRMRFEVLKRDAEIQRLRDGLDRAGGDIDAAALQAELDALDADFAFLAAANEGGEFMDDADIDRVRALAARTWTRTLDDRLGVSHAEQARKADAPPPPVVEPLLADRPEHRRPRAPEDRLLPDNPWGFRMEAPELLYDRGEVHNLTIRRGTLTEEERYKINEHIVQTIKMLDNLHFPKHLRAVPEIAGGHHEKMDGSGYPKRLKGDEMSPVARMMAVADIFEALTAADRPYKKGKTLSEALRIMGFMVKDGHIDPDLFDLFLTSGVYRDYAARYMRPEQVDEVDPEAFRVRSSVDA